MTDQPAMTRTFRRCAVAMDQIEQTSAKKGGDGAFRKPQNRTERLSVPTFC